MPSIQKVNSGRFWQKSWGLALLVVAMGVVNLQPLLKVAGAQNDLALCWVQSDEPAQTCERQLDRLIDLSAVSREAKLAAVRYLGLAQGHQQLISFLAGEEQQELDFLAAYMLLQAYRQLGEFRHASAFVSAAHVPGSLVVSWGMEANNQGHKNEARNWLYLADVNGANLDWSSRRWLGFLWWDAERDSEKAITYLEPVLAEMPESIYTRRLLGKIYRNESPDLSVAILEEALRLAPDDLFVYRELMLSLLRRGRHIDLDRIEELTPEVLPLINEYLGEHPEAVSIRQWLLSLSGD